MTAISQRDRQDLEDGRALRELWEALPEDVFMTVETIDREWSVDVERGGGGPEVGPLFDDAFIAPTIAEAADACRAALVAK